MVQGFKENIKMVWKYKEKWYIIKQIVNIKENFSDRNSQAMES
jgi:hypothetical protein